MDWVPGTQVEPCGVVCQVECPDPERRAIGTGMAGMGMVLRLCVVGLSREIALVLLVEVVRGAFSVGAGSMRGFLGMVSSRG